MKRAFVLAAIMRVAAACALALSLSACATVPETGRRELLLMSPREEMQLGLSEFQKMKESTPISRDPAINALLQNVGHRIAAVVPMRQAEWEFVVFDEPKTANAFCLPGGKVGVFTGLLPITRDEVGLATVVGHEIAHAVARHGGERMSRGLLIQFGGMILGEALKTDSQATRDLALQAYGLGSTLGVMLPHSRMQEIEADHLGLIYMARAGYDPRQAVEFWKRFADYSAKQGSQPLQFLSTHPVDAVRIEKLEEELPNAIAEYEQALAAPE